MVGTGGIPVTLSEVLEVRDTPLSESEIWSILITGLPSLQKLLAEAKKSVSLSGVNLETVLLYPDGSVCMRFADSAPLPDGADLAQFLPDGLATDACLNDAQVEKVYTYSVGSVLNHALMYGDKALSASPDLLSLLNLMTVSHADTRPTLAKVHSIAVGKAEARGIQPVEAITDLYRSIMGSDTNLFIGDDLPKSDDAATQSTPRLTNMVNEALSPLPPPMVDQTPSENTVPDSVAINNKSSSISSLTSSSSVHSSSTSSSSKAHSAVFKDEGQRANGEPAVDNIKDAIIGADAREELDFSESPMPVESKNNLALDDELTDIGSPMYASSRYYEVASSTPVAKTLKHYSTVDESPILPYDSELNKSNEAEECSDVESRPDSAADDTTTRPQFEPLFYREALNQWPSVPGDLTDYTSPDYHDRRALRAYHSVSCGLCSAVKRRERLGKTADRSTAAVVDFYRPGTNAFSLPDLIRDSDVPGYRLASLGYASLSPAELRRKLVRADYADLERRILRLTSSDVDPCGSAKGTGSDWDQPVSAKTDPFFSSFEDIARRDQLKLSAELEEFSLDSPIKHRSESELAHTLQVSQQQDISETSQRREVSESSDVEKVNDSEDRKFEDESSNPFDEESADESPTNAILASVETTVEADLEEKIKPITEPSPKDDRPTPRPRTNVPNGKPADDSAADLKQVAVLLAPERRRKRSQGTPEAAEKRQRELVVETPSPAPPVVPRSRGHSKNSVNGSNAETENEAANKNETEPAVPEEKENVAGNHFVVDAKVEKPVRASRQPPPPPAPVIAQDVQQKPVRRNKDMVGPEFLYNCRLPSILLKTPSAGKRPAAVWKGQASPRTVQILLLNGQRVDVACHTQTSADEIFHAVVTHTNLSEHVFFGLTYLRDGEHFFFKPEEKIIKAAPNEWKDHRRGMNTRILYTLFLRLQFYPDNMDFVRSDKTLHQVYLQLRRDLTEERLQCDRDSAFQLAALALQAEYGDAVPDNNITYFQLDHYLPQRHLVDEMNMNSRVVTVLAELHIQYAGVHQYEAEIEFVRKCMSLREYGIHFHRLFKSKPSHSHAPSPLGDPDTGTSIWVGILPKGVIIFEEKSGERMPISQHPWHKTQTLRFNHKKFAIVPRPEDGAEPIPDNQSAEHGGGVFGSMLSLGKSSPDGPKLVYFADSHKKSGYFVWFAEVQHKFGIKMRGWTQTLSKDDTLGRQKAMSTLSEKSAQGQHSKNSSDSGISREASPTDRIDIGDYPSARNHLGGQHRRQPSPAGNAVYSNRDRSESAGRNGPTALDVSVPSRDRTLSQTHDDTMSSSLAERMENSDRSDLSPISPSDYDLLRVQLIKDNRLGLGLTLVDGEIQGLKGVYVKSVTAGGPADVNGKLKIGDRLVSIDGHNLEGHNRHDAVELVRRGSGRVNMTLMRLHCLNSSEESLAGDEDAYPRSDSNLDSTQARSMTIPAGYSSTDIEEALMANAVRSKLRSRSDMAAGGGKSATMPSRFTELNRAESLSSHSSASSGKNAASGANPPQHPSAKYKPELTAPDPRAADGGSMRVPKHELNLLQNRPYGQRPQEAAAVPYGQPGSYRTAPADLIVEAQRPSMYGGLHSSDSEDESVGFSREGSRRHKQGSSLRRRGSGSTRGSGRRSGGRGSAANGWGSKPTPQHDKIPEEQQDRFGASDADRIRDDSECKSEESKDWIDDLQLHDENFLEKDMEIVEVKLLKNGRGGLGIKVAGGGRGQKDIYVKALLDEPAISCPDIQPGDKVLSVGGRSTKEMSHHEVVGLLKSSTSPVSIVLGRHRPTPGSGSTPGASSDPSARKESDTQDLWMTVEVVLEKPETGSLGLSLARPAAGSGKTEGIFIRVISPNSTADIDGRLKVGDRLWAINDESVENASPWEVVEKLKATKGSVHIVVKREIPKQQSFD